MSNSNLCENEKTSELQLIAKSAYRQSSKLKRFLRKYERDESRIDDIIQEAFLEAIRCVDSFHGDSLENWFFGIAANIARAHVAKRTRESSVMVYFDHDIGDIVEYTDDARHLPTYANADPFSKVHFKRLTLLILKEVDELPDKLKAVFVLACDQDYSYCEIACLTGIPVGTVRSRIHRARDIVRHKVLFAE